MNLVFYFSCFTAVTYTAKGPVTVLNIVATIFKNLTKCQSHFCCEKFVFGITTQLPHYELIGHGTGQDKSSWKPMDTYVLMMMITVL